MVPFSKYSGCGNDFVIFDNRKLFFPTDNIHLIQRLCSRCHGIGADGIILLEHSVAADFKMRIFNLDGSEAEMCGNGIRCLLDFIQRLGYSQKSYSIETLLRTLKATFEGNQPSIEMGIPQNVQWNLNLQIEKQTIPLQYLDTGVPHAILFVDDIDRIDIKDIAPKIRHHPDLGPKGANVNFIEITNFGEAKIRTYERGVEQETLACGTGATAGALAISKYYGWKSPIKMRVRSGEILTISFDSTLLEQSSITMAGPANFIFQGEVLLT